MGFIIAIVLATVFGGLQFFLLWKGVCAMEQGRPRALYFAAQFLCPIVALGLCVWLAKEWLILTATIICAILIVDALVHTKRLHK